MTLEDAGIVVQPVRQKAIEASEGTTDFGQYFFYFSFFLVVAALLLTGLFFRVGVEQRLRRSACSKRWACHLGCARLVPARGRGAGGRGIAARCRRRDPAMRR